MKVDNNRLYNLIARYGFSIIAALLLGIASWYAYYSKLFPKYETQVYTDKSSYKDCIDYYDLNNDGLDEFVELRNQNGIDGKCYLNIRVKPFENYKVISQTSWDYSVPVYSCINVCDYNNDGIKEIFIILKDDSALRLIGLKPEFKILKDASVLFDKFITHVHVTKKGFDDFYLYPFRFADLNNDGFKEIIFSVNGGYKPYPRKIFYYDIKNDSLYQSPDSLLIQYNGIAIGKSGKRYYILPEWVTSPGNIHDTMAIKYHDWADYVYLFNDSLKPAFPPIRLSNAYNSTNEQQFVQFNGRTRILTLNNRHQVGEAIYLYSLQGELLKKIKLSKNKIYRLKHPIDTSKYLATISYGNNLTFLTKDFKLKHKFTISNVNKNGSPPVMIGNFDTDDKPEYLTITDFQKNLKLFDDDFSLIFSFPLSHDISPHNAHLVVSELPFYIIHLRSVNRTLTIGYRFNNTYYLSYLFAILTTLMFFVLFQIAIKQRLRFVEKQNNLEKNLIESQLKIANRQMTPHFQLNVLNSVSYLFEKEKEKAQYYLGKYLKMVTQTMMNVDKLTTTIENEISFINNYLKLEQLRLNFKFDFSIDIDKNIDQSIQIPKMVLFTFCENAVKHGFFHKESKGYLNIKGRQEDKKTITFVIEDNGIGRSEAKKIKTGGTGMGIKTLNRIIAYFNKSGSVKIKYQLVDKDEGLKVILELSLQNQKSKNSFDL